MRDGIPFAAASQGVVFPEGEAGEVFRHQQAPHVRVAFKADSVHVVGFPLRPQGRAPALDGAGDPGVVLRDGSLQREPVVVDCRIELVNGGESFLDRGVVKMEVVDSRYIYQEVEFQAGL